MEDNEMIVKHHVPILDEHELKDGKGNVVIRLDQKKLSEIVRVNNKRMGSTGDEIPLVIGHTKDDASEDDQPEIVGYATDLKVEPFFKTGRKCITATFKFFKHAADKVRGFPRRSIELWLSDYKIDPISLLGATTPERDLGLLRLSKGGVKKYQRTIGMNDQQGIIEGVLAGLQQTDVWQFLTQLSQQGGEAPPEEGGMPPEGMPGEQPPMPEQGMEDPSMGGEQPPMPEEGGEEPMPEESTEEEEPIQQSRGKRYDRIKLSRVEQENQLLQKEIHNIKIKFQRAEREKDLIELEAEGFMLDRGEELALVQSLPENTYRSHLQIIRKRYQRAPLGARSSYYQESRSGGQRGRTKDEVNSAIDYATANGISYQEALGKINAEKVL